MEKISIIKGDFDGVYAIVNGKRETFIGPQGSMVNHIVNNYNDTLDYLNNLTLDKDGFGWSPDLNLKCYYNASQIFSLPLQLDFLDGTNLVGELYKLKWHLINNIKKEKELFHEYWVAKNRL